MGKRARGTGGVSKPKNSSFWYISYVVGGKRHFESTKSTIKKVAQDLLLARLGDAQRGIAVTPKLAKVTIAEALKAVVDDLKMNGRKSAGASSFTC
jgi:hypothetical protein